MIDAPAEKTAAALREEGNALYVRGLYAEAASRYEAALGLDPADADSQNNLGAALADLGRLAESIPRYREALRLRPDFGDAYYNLGNAQRHLGRLSEAVASYAEALRLRPGMAEGHNNLGISLRRLHRPTEAAISLREALRLRPGFASAMVNLGLVMADVGRFPEAIALADEAIRIEPGNADAHRNRSLSLLTTGDLGRGLPEYEWRWRCSDFRPMSLPGPAWRGEPLDGRRILLHAEQGLGDAIMFARFAASVADRGGRVVLSAPESIHPILATAPGVDRLVGRVVDPADFDLHAPLMSVPAILGLTTEAIPAQVPYLSADPARVDRWRGELAGVDGFRVGVAWQGNPTTHYDRSRSFPAAQLAPIAGVEGARLVSLQRGRGAEQVDAASGRFEVVDLGGRGLDDDGAFLDTAAVMRNLDLVVTCDSALSHLAGALGVPTWLALPLVPDWRWFLDREDSPWYPRHRLFRQEMAGDWSRPIRRMAAALRSIVRETGATP